MFIMIRVSRKTFLFWMALPGPPDTPHLFRKISDIRHIPHSEEGVKAGASLCFIHVGLVLGEIILMGDCCKEHFDTNPADLWPKLLHFAIPKSAFLK